MWRQTISSKEAANDGRVGDCHAHVFGPYDRFPLAPDRSYTPPEAPLEDYLALLERLGLSRGVLVHPSAYGEDYSLLRNVLALQPQLRGVIVARDIRATTLAQLRDHGVRAARFSHRSGAGTNFAGSASFADLVRMTTALADAHMHAELWTDCKVLPAIAPNCAGSRFPWSSITWAASTTRRASTTTASARCSRCSRADTVWVKLCAYRNTLKAPGIELARPFHDTMLAANPSQLVWGSDWPHLNVKPAPDAAQLLRTFKEWTPEPLVSTILLDNPARLYA